MSIKCMDVKFKAANNSYDGWMDGYSDVDTVEKMFDYIQVAVEEDSVHKIEYDTELGYPKLIWVDFFRRGSDQARKLIVRKFEIQPKSQQ